MKKRIQDMGIRGRLFALLLSVLIPVLFIVGYVSYHGLQESKADAFRDNLEVARAVARTFDAFVADVLHTELAIGRAATASPAPSDESLREIMREAKAANHMIRYLSWISPEGIHLVSTNPRVEGTPGARPDLFEKLRAGGEWEITSVFSSSYIEEQVFAIAKAIRDPEAKILGFVACAVSPSELDALLGVSRSKGAGVSLVDSAGIHVFRHPEVPLTPGQSNRLESIPEMRPALHGQEVVGIFTSPINGKKRLAAFVPCALSGWVVSASRGEYEVFSSIVPNLIRQVLLILVLSLGAFGSALVFIRPINLSIFRLRNGALALGRGEVEELEVFSGPAELVELAATFDEMGKAIRNRQRALQESERHIRAIIESTEDAIVTIDQETRILEANPAASALTGVHHDQLLGRFMKSFVDLDTDPPSTWERFFQAGRYHGEILIQPDGGGPKRIVEASGIANIGAGRHLIVAHDITERKQAEAGVQITLQRFYAVLSNMYAGLLLVKEEGRVEFANQAFCDCLDLNDPPADLVGLTASEILAKIGKAYVHPEEAVARILEVVRRGQPVKNELVPMRNGRVLLRDFVPLVMNGKSYGRLWYHTDITERKHAEEALRESERNLMGAIEIAELGTWDYDVVHSVTHCDERCRSIFGLAEGPPVQNEEAYDLIHEEDRPRVLEAVNAALDPTGRGVYESEHRIIRPDGTLKWVIVRGHAVWGDEGSSRRPLRLCGTVMDLTERKHMEEELRKARDELEIRVRARTAEVERRNEELQNFTYAASHDLQEPLRKLQTFSDLLAIKFPGEISEQGRDYLRRMHETATRMRDVLQSLLKYSRLTARPEPFERVDLNGIAGEVISDLSFRIRETGASVEIGDLPEIEADPAQMRQLLQNLLENALKFGREGEQPKVRIHSDRDGIPQNGQCELYVEDDGIGFEEKYMDLIFRPFQRLHGKNEYGGVGMGLAICAKVVQQHNGRITARSTPGEGSTFIVTLPVRQDEI